MKRLSMRLGAFAVVLFLAIAPLAVLRSGGAFAVSATPSAATPLASPQAAAPMCPASVAPTFTEAASMPLPPRPTGVQLTASHLARMFFKDAQGDAVDMVSFQSEYCLEPDLTVKISQETSAGATTTTNRIAMPGTTRLTVLSGKLSVRIIAMDPAGEASFGRLGANGAVAAWTNLNPSSGIVSLRPGDQIVLTEVTVAVSTPGGTAPTIIESSGTVQDEPGGGGCVTKCFSFQ